MRFLVIFVNLSQIFRENMYTLILDTSTKIALIALIKERCVCTCHFYTHDNQLSKSFFPAIESALALYPKIDRIAVGIGPGSYTGTRVGVTAARVLSFGLKVDLRSFYSPLAYLPNHFGYFSFLLPNKSDQFILIKGMQSKHSLESEDPQLIEKKDILKKLAHSDYLVSGHSFDQLEIPQYLPAINPQILIPLVDNIFLGSIVKNIFYHHSPI